MSYVGAPFEHDLFVTYSHGDDGTGRGFLQPWSAAFARELETELRADRTYRQALRVFLDADLRPGHGVDPLAPLTDQLRDQIGGAALLVVLMSPDYLASKWCADEREWWCDRQRQLGLPSDERIAVVRVWPTRDPWPAALCDARGEQLPGFRFFEESSGAPRPLGWADLPATFTSEARKALLAIVGRLYTKLDAMKQRAEALRQIDTSAARLQQERDLAIYLHGRDDRRQAWDVAAQTLLDGGYSVFPGEPDPAGETPQALLELRERRVETLTGCDALLLLGTDDGRALDADLVTVGRLDRQSARARSQRLLPCGVLDTVGAPVATAVRKASARIVQADWLDGTHPPWTPQVRQWLADKGAEAARRR